MQLRGYNPVLREIRQWDKEGIGTVINGSWSDSPIDFYAARQRWLALKDSLAAFGFNVVQEKE
jgi:hypothetical protein